MNSKQPHILLGIVAILAALLLLQELQIFLTHKELTRARSELEGLLPIPYEAVRLQVEKASGMDVTGIRYDRFRDSFCLGCTLNKFDDQRRQVRAQLVLRKVENGYAGDLVIIGNSQPSVNTITVRKLEKNSD